MELLLLLSDTRFSFKSPMQDELIKQTVDKGQLISDGNFGVFKSPKKPTKF